MAFIKVKGDLSAIEKALKEEPKLARAAAVSAINKTTLQAQTAGVRELAKLKRVPVRMVKRRTKIIRASVRGSLKQIENHRSVAIKATLVTLTAGLPIDQLKTFDLKKGGISAVGKTYPHAFRAKVGGHKALIFERRVAGAQRVGRLPIDRVKIPLNPEADTIFRNAVAKMLATKTEQIFERELAFRVARRAALS